jgi:hypothetical protein
MRYSEPSFTRICQPELSREIILARGMMAGAVYLLSPLAVLESEYTEGC